MESNVFIDAQFVDVKIKNCGGHTLNTYIMFRNPQTEDIFTFKVYDFDFIYEVFDEIFVGFIHSPNEENDMEMYRFVYNKEYDYTDYISESENELSDLEDIHGLDIQIKIVPLEEVRLFIKNKLNLTKHIEDYYN